MTPSGQPPTLFPLLENGETTFVSAMKDPTKWKELGLRVTAESRVPWSDVLLELHLRSKLLLPHATETWGLCGPTGKHFLLMQKLC